MGPLKRMLVLGSWMWCPSWCCAVPRLTCPVVRAGYTSGAPSSWSRSKACVSNVDLTTLAADTVDFRYPQSQVVLDWPKVTRDSHRPEANRLYDVPGKHVANSVDSRPDKARSQLILACHLGERRVTVQYKSPLGPFRRRHSPPPSLLFVLLYCSVGIGTRLRGGWLEFDSRQG
jgi:hypothetical protein